MIFIVTDLHLTDRAKDSYRFGIFDFAISKIKKYKCDTFLMLGDCTDKKDNHSSTLVNKIVDGFERISKHADVVILKGNHDYYSDSTNPFFKFLNHIKNITFITEPRLMYENMFFIPHLESEEEWDNLRCDKRPDYAFIHQTVTGAVSESGRRLDGASLKPLKRLKAKLILGGDVHKPHTVGPVTYIGPPYHVRFGDNFKPRCVLLDEETSKIKDLFYDCPSKWSIKIGDPEELYELDFLKKGDQVKVKLQLTKEEVTEWSSLKAEVNAICKELGLESYGIELDVEKRTEVIKKEDLKRQTRNRSPNEILKSFSRSERLPSQTKKEGLRILAQ